MNSTPNKNATLNDTNTTTEPATGITALQQEETLEQLMRRLETKGEQQAKKWLTSNETVPVKNVQESILNIIREGETEFVQKTGRYMTYSEMRQMYG